MGLQLNRRLMMARLPSRVGARLVGYLLASLLPFIAASVFAAGTGLPNAAPGKESSIYRMDTGIDDSGVYKNEVQACLSGKTHQARETCLEEARSAMAEKRRGQVATPREDFLANAMARCEPLVGEDKAACQARVMGKGSVTGSVADGGLLREVETVVLPPGATLTMKPQTSHPVVVIPQQPH
jgi:hypothetical protein